MTDNRNFFAREIRVLTEDATGPDHNGEPFINTDYPKGTILCVDNDGLVFNCAKRPMGKGALGSDDPNLDPACWPRRTREGIPLFRDYWTFAYDSNDHAQLGAKGAPYFRAIHLTPYICIVPPLNDEEQIKLKPYDPDHFWDDTHD